MFKNILVTGGSGFVGHHIVDYLLRYTNYDVTILDRLDLSGSLIRLEEVLATGESGWRQRVNFVWHDLKAPINSFISSSIGDCSYILHLAASSHVDRSIENPMEFVMDNVVGTCNLLDYARTLPNLKKFLYFSTDEVFGPAPEGVKYVEWARYNSGNPYSASKAGAEELCLAYSNTYKMNICVSHTMNVCGKRQHPEKFIPLVIRKVLKGETVLIHSDSSCSFAGKRHYIDATDVADAVQFLIEKGQKGDKYNIVGEREIDNLTLAEMIADIVGKPLCYKMVDFHSSRPGHDLRYALDGTKMAEMGWEPRKSIEERLEEIVQWSLAHPKWLGM